MASTLAGYVSHKRTGVFHARDLMLHNRPDLDWIEHLSSSGEDWLIITGDGKIRKNRAEREAYRRANLKGIVLSPAYQKTPMGRCCGTLVAKWDSLIEFTARIEAPFLVEVSINLTPRFKVLPL